MTTSETITAIVTLTLNEFYHFKELAQQYCKKFVIEDTSPSGVTISSEETFLNEFGYIDLTV